MSFIEHHYFGPSSYRKARPASGSSSGFHSQRRRLTYSQPSSDNVDTFNGDMTRRSEKEILQSLNDRFAGYIDKVRSLEMHNRNLEAEAAALRQSQTGRASVGEHYERELGELRALLQQLSGERARAALEQEHLEEDIQHVRARLEDEARNREELEAASRAMKKYGEECRLARLELDKKLHALEEESAFLKKNHEEEVSELLAQIQGTQVNFDVQETLKTDITTALREIRAQLDNHASKSAMHAEEWFKVRTERLSGAARTNQDAIRATQEEIADYRRQLQGRTIELETLRGTKESLERQRIESEDRHQDELNSLQETINHLDSELKSTKWEMASQLKDYQELLNVKMALDIEIAAYRKLLEGEENRFLSGGGPYSYLEGRIFGHTKVKEEISDRVIVEEQTDETQVTEVTEEADDEDEDNKEPEEDEEEESKDVEEQDDKDEENDKEDEKEEEEDKTKSPKSPSESPAAKTPESPIPQKSPVSKSPAKSPAVKSPAGDESKTPEPLKSPEKEKPAAAKDAPKKEEEPPVKDEKKEKEQPVIVEKKPMPKEKEAESKAEKGDDKKEIKVEQEPKKDEGSKPDTPANVKPKEEKPSDQKSDKSEQDTKPAQKTQPEEPEPKKAEKKPEQKPDKTEVKKEDKKSEEKKDVGKEDSKKKDAKTEKSEKSSSTEGKK